MKVGDLVTIAGWRHEDGLERPVGLVTCFDPEEIGDPEEVAVLWTSVWCDEANHSSDTLEGISGAH